MDFSATSKVVNGRIQVEVNVPEANEYTLYAYYLYKEGRDVLQKQWYIKENTFSFLPPESGSYRVKAFVRYKDRAEDEYVQKTSQFTNTVLFYKTKEIQYKDIEWETFHAPKATLYRIMWDGVPFEFLIHSKENCDKAVVFGTGDVGNNPRDTWPRFARNTWSAEIPANAIYYFDPTVYLGDTSLGWGYGTNDCWYLERIAVLLNRIFEALTVKRENVLFFGSSAGGYMSMILAALLQCKATVINPQFIVENFWPHLVEKFKSAVLKQGESLISKRCDAVKFFCAEGYFPYIHLIQNICAQRDMSMQAIPFLQELVAEKINCADCFHVDFYGNEGGHGAMPSKEVCLRIIEEDLARRVSSTALNNQDTGKGTFLQLLSTHLGNAGQNSKCNFDTSFLPAPPEYFSGENAVKKANDILNGTLWVFPSIEGMPYSLEAMDWNVRFSKVANTFQLYLQGLTPVQFLCTAFKQTKNTEYLFYADKFFRCWQQYAYSNSNNKENPFTWNDHVVALRAENLMYLGQVCSSVGIWPDALYDNLCRLLPIHGEWLNSDTHYTKRHNHGIMQDQALLHLGVVLNRPKWVEHAKQRLLIQKAWAFNEEMVHTENSPGYAFLVPELFRKIGRFLQLNQDPLGDQLIADMENTQMYLDWSRMPNGITAQIGDTGGSVGVLYSTEENMKRKTEEIHKIYPQAGVYFYRSNQNEHPMHDTWKTIKAGYVQKVHKHADDGSFMLYAKGYEVFTDGGVYGYENNPFREYFTSAKAHNSIVVDDMSYPCDAAHMNMVGISEHQFFANYDHIRIFNHAYDGVCWERDFCSADDLTILMDSLASETEHTYSQVFHLAEQMEVLEASNCEVLIKLADSGFVVRIRQFGDLTQLTVINGNKAVPSYGLISRAVNHLDTITTLKFDLTAKTGIFATAITIEDVDGRVRLFDRHEKANLLRYDANEKAFTLGDLRIPSDRYQSAPPKKIALSIFGSCVSRDILEYATDKRFDLKTYIARQSVLSAISNPLDGIAEHDISLKSAFQRRMVLSDIQKDALKTLQNDGSEYLLIDLIDERFPLTIIHNSICTVSSEFASGLPELCKQHPQYKKKLVDRRLYLGEHTVDRMINIFCEQLSQIYPVDHIVLHRAKLVDHYIANDGSQKSFPESRLQSNREINEILDHMYRRIEEHLPTIKIIDEMEGVYAAESHKWGLAPMHFQDTYYRRVLSKLQSIIM